MNKRAWLMAVLIGTGFIPLARATTLVQLSLEQLAQASSEIIRGRVVSQESRWNSTRTRIVTLTTIALEQTVKGHPAATLVIEQPGGTVGNLHTRVAGIARFDPQTSYLLFLEPSSTTPSRYRPVGMVQGAYRIYRDSATHEERIIRPPGGSFHGTRESGGRVITSAETASLADFRRRLSAALQTPIVIPPGTSLPLIIQATESRGAGRVRVLGRTTADIYPSGGVVIPAGSFVEGTGQRLGEKWKIRWTDVSIRGVRVEISASSEEATGEALRGRVLVVKVR